MASQPINPRTNAPYRPIHLPPPTTLPLRHCSHNEDSTPIDETSCLLSLLSPNPGSKKNKEHYVLATADPPAPEKVAASTADAKKRKRGVDEAEDAMRRAKALRISARAVPGVPIIYVKRSVMILEPMSTPSEDVREDVERGKFRAGLDGDTSLGKRKRSDEEGKKKGGVKKAKGPNPLSAKKPKKRANEGDASGPSKRENKERGVIEAKEVADGPEKSQDGDAAPKPKRKRRHHKGAKRDGDDDGAGQGEAAVAESMD